MLNGVINTAVFGHVEAVVGPTKDKENPVGIEIGASSGPESNFRVTLALTPDAARDLVKQLQEELEKATPHRHIPLDQIVGKTIQRVVHGSVEGSNGDEPCVYLQFADKTQHGFVLPAE
jgi:hypothetical protein